MTGTHRKSSLRRAVSGVQRRVRRWAVGLALLPLLAMGCQQDLGERCQQNSDCTSGICNNSAMVAGVCTNGNGTVAPDAGSSGGSGGSGGAGGSGGVDAAGGASVDGSRGDATGDAGVEAPAGDAGPSADAPDDGDAVPADSGDGAVGDAAIGDGAPGDGPLLDAASPLDAPHEAGSGG
jgi:hypothetical protein